HRNPVGGRGVEFDVAEILLLHLGRQEVEKRKNLRIRKLLADLRQHALPAAKIPAPVMDDRDSGKSADGLLRCLRPFLHGDVDRGARRAFLKHESPWTSTRGFSMPGSHPRNSTDRLPATAARCAAHHFGGTAYLARIPKRAAAS